MLREIISRCKTIKYCADNFTQDFGLDLLKYFYNQTKEKNETILELLWKSRIGLFLGKMGQHLPSQKNL